MTERQHSKNNRWLRGALVLLALALATILTALPARAETPPWPESPFSYLGKEQQLDKMLVGFAKAFGLQIRIETPLPEGLAAISGRSAAATPTEFITQLTAGYGLTWYYNAGTLYISRANERVTRMLPTKGMSGVALKKAFTEMGFLDARFGWAEVDER
ncbi:MAG: hypothetical protein H7255_16290, partial [Ramlibacter sp.]|nr:hypothetical protein [Ramlibacter sp.]